jgi:hypothetical protein
MRRITKAALGAVAGCALALGGMQAASGETLLQQVFPGWLTDLDTNGSPATTGAFDSAKAKLKVIEASDGNTTFSLEVREIDPSFKEQIFVSHLHTGGCAIDNPTGTSGHYQATKPNLVYPANEVWFHLEVDKDGDAVDQTTVPFVPNDDGVMSIVIHSNLPGATKEVCLPLDVSDIFPSTISTE